jgi:hypothetical protein
MKTLHTTVAVVLLLSPGIRADWGSITITNQDGGGKKVVLENSRLKCTYSKYRTRHYYCTTDQTAITELINKSAGGTDQVAGEFLDAQARTFEFDRGLLTTAEIIYDKADRKTVRLFWDNSFGSIQDVTVFPDKPFLRIDYHRYYRLISDLGSAGGNDNVWFAINGAAGWTPSVVGGNRYRLTHPRAYWRPALHNHDADAGSLNYKNFLVMASFNRGNGQGWGRVMPISDIAMVKLLWMRGFEWLPDEQPGEPCHPFAGYLYVGTGSEAGLIAAGKQVADFGATAPGMGAVAIAKGYRASRQFRLVRAGKTLHGDLIVSVSTPMVGEIVLRSLSGQVVKEIKGNDRCTYRISTAKLGSGLYVLSVHGAGKVFRSTVNVMR